MRKNQPHRKQLRRERAVEVFTARIDYLGRIMRGKAADPWISPYAAMAKVRVIRVARANTEGKIKDAA